MISFKQYLIEVEDYEKFLKAHFGSETTPSPVLKSKFSGQPHPDIPITIIKPSVTLPHDPTDERATERWHSIMARMDPKVSAWRTHDEIPILKFHSETMRTNKRGAKYHILRYDASEAMSVLDRLNDQIKKIPPVRGSKGGIIRQIPNAVFLNDPYTPWRHGTTSLASLHTNQTKSQVNRNIKSIDSILRATHNLNYERTPSSYYLANDILGVTDHERDLSKQGIITYAAELKSQGGDDDTPPPSAPKEPKPDLSFDISSGSSRRKPVMSK